jgi:3,4-dihydroxy 2-butanone 4-phosphate synthase/GTP cyclohydrolase II
MFNSIEEAIQDIKEGKMVILVDDEDRENEGDVLVAAEKATPEIINFMATHARGLICVPMLGERLDELEIKPMVLDNTDNHETAISIVSKRLANRLIKNMERKEPENEQNQTCTGRGC